MEVLFKIVLTILVFLAISSGITKIMLMQQDVEFFGEYGFTSPILIAYGVIQLIGGILLIIPKTRFIGAATVAISFLISAIILILAGKLPVAIVTFAAILLLGIIMKNSYAQRSLVSTK